MLQSVIKAIARLNRGSALARLHAGTEAARLERDDNFASILEGLVDRVDGMAPNPADGALDGAEAEPAQSGAVKGDERRADLRAEIRVGPNVVARVFNNGAWELAADDHGHLAAALSGARFGSLGPGPALADQVIARLAVALEQSEVAIDWAPTAGKADPPTGALAPC